MEEKSVTSESTSNVDEDEKEDVILESLDDSDKSISSVESLPNDLDLAQSRDVTGKSNSSFADVFAGSVTPKSTGRNPRTNRTLGHSEDFETINVDPRGAVGKIESSKPPQEAQVPAEKPEREEESEKLSTSSSVSVSAKEDEDVISSSRREPSYSEDSFESDASSTER